MKKLLQAVLCVLFMLPAISFSQALYPVKIEEKIINSTLIAEGKVISQNSFWNTNHSMIYTSNVVEVYKTFKGTLTSSNVEIMTVGGTVGNENIQASELAELRVGDLGMFFCYPNVINLKNPLTNKLLLDIYSSSQGFLKYNLQDETASAPFERYDNIMGNLYNVIQGKTGEAFHNLVPAFTAVAPILPQNPTAPSITFFTPASVVAGATENSGQNLLTINGSGFGTATGSAAVLFDDANDGTGGTDYTVAYSDNLVLSWTDTQIKLKVPSRAGTGNIKIRDQAGVSATSASPLEVLYSVLTASFFVSPTTLTIQSNLMNANGAGGYTILYSTSTSGSGLDLSVSPVKSTFLRALNTWKEINGFNISEGSTTTVQTVSNDGNNVIMFDNSNTGNTPLAAGVLATCYSYNSICLPLGSYAGRKTGFDIVIRTPGFSNGTTTFENGPCYPATSDVDMETVLLHELGHAINLGHINDDYQYVGGSFFTINPGKVMNYAVINGVARKSPDYAAYAGAAYCINPKGLSYGNCTAANTEMVPVSVTVEAKDECPVFPSAATPGNSLIHFDLVHATSNKYTDPQYTAVNCSATGTGVINTAYFAFKTNTTSGGTLSIQVLNYTTYPVSLAGCASQGVTLTLYPVSSCPLGQNFPMPTTCRTFTTNGTISSITGLPANTTYLIMASGLNGTKASFDLLINGNALPINLRSFSGSAKALYNELTWKLDIESNVNQIILESSVDRINFTELQAYQASHVTQTINEVFQDQAIADKKYYRLRITYVDGRVEYSSILLLKRSNNSSEITVTPNPAKDFVNVDINSIGNQTIVLSLVGATGKIVLTKKVQLVQGRQVLQLNQLQHFGRGIYLLQVNDGETTMTQKVVLN